MTKIVHDPSAAVERRATERRTALSRRRFLRGVGATVALPMLPSLTSLRALGAEAARAGNVSAAPVRMALITIPNGCNQENWWPTGEGAAFTLNKTMAPLARVKQSIQVISGMDHLNATAGRDGAGDHARANATLLTGMRAKKTAGSDIQLGISVDQAAAQQVGHLTRFASLELTSDPRRQSKSCDSGYACAYQFNVSWRSAITPMPPESSPRLVFERLFGSGPHGQRSQSLQLRQETQRSILDFVLDDARSLKRSLGGKDVHKMDEYLTSIRDIERRIERAESFGAAPDPAVETPPSVPSEVGPHMDLMYDLMVLAFQTDSTRIATLMLGHDGDNRPYPELGVPEGHHNISHHQNKSDLLDKLGRIDRHHIERFARFLEKLAATREADGSSLLDSSMIVYAGGNADPNRHRHTNLPVILAGGGNGSLTPGRFLQAPSQPMSNLFVDLLHRMGADELDRFGDSDGRSVGV